MPFDYTVLGHTIKALRKERHLSQEVLSGLAGIARTHLTMIENATIHANIETIWKISFALGLKPSALFAIIEDQLNPAP